MAIIIKNLYIIMIDYIKTFFSPHIKINVDLHINGIGIYEPIDIFMIDRPSGTGDCLLMCFHDTSIIGINGEERQFEPTRIILWPTGTRQQYGNSKIHNRNWKHSWIHFDGVFAHKLFKKLEIPIATPLEFFGSDDMADVLREMHHELTTFHKPELVVIKNLFENLMLKIKRGLSRNEATFVPQFLLKTRMYMDNNPCQLHSLEYLAEMSGYSIPHFSALFKKHFGTSPVNYATRLRMNHAAYLLHDLNLTISDVSRKLGFNDIFHFSRRFKEYFGICPREMRAQLFK